MCKDEVHTLTLLGFVAYAINAHAVSVVSSSLDTKQFRFRFEMLTAPTHSRVFAARRHRRGRLNFGDPSTCTRENGLGAVGNRGEMSFMPSIHV